MRTHYKKIWPEYFEAVVEGRKTFEVRVNTDNYKEGEHIILEEWNPESKQYTGKSIGKKIGYVLNLRYVDEAMVGHVSFSLLPIESELT